MKVYIPWKLLTTRLPVDTGRKLNVHKTFNLRPVSTGLGYQDTVTEDPCSGIFYTVNKICNISLKFHEIIHMAEKMTTAFSVSHL